MVQLKALPVLLSSPVCPFQFLHGTIKSGNTALYNGQAFLFQFLMVQLKADILFKLDEPCIDISIPSW